MDKTTAAPAPGSAPTPQPTGAKPGSARAAAAWETRRANAAAKAAAEAAAAATKGSGVRDAFGNEAPAARGKAVNRKPLRSGEAIGIDGQIVSRSRALAGYHSEFDFPPHLIPDGFSAQWVRTTCHGKPDNANYNHHYSQGWRPAPSKMFASAFPDINDGDRIERDGLILMLRPTSLNHEALAEQHASALELRQVQSEAFGHRKLARGFEEGRVSGDGKFNASRKVNREGYYKAPAEAKPQLQYATPGDDD